MAAEFLDLHLYTYNADSLSASIGGGYICKYVNPQHMSLRRRMNIIGACRGTTRPLRLGQNFYTIMQFSATSATGQMQLGVCAPFGVGILLFCKKQFGGHRVLIVGTLIPLLQYFW